MLGIPIDPLECMTILQSLGLELIEKASDSFTIRVPSHRLDLKTEIDLIEEITRLHGLDKIPISSPTAISGGGRRDDSYYSIQTIHEELIQLGLTECIHSSFLDRNVPKISGIPYEAILGIRNPIDQGERVMRPSLLPSMLKTVDDNRNHGNHTLALFELGKVMIRNGKEIKEENQACIILTGHKHPEPFSEEKKILYDIYDLRGLIDDWLKKRRIDSYIQSDRFGQGLGYRKGYFHPAFTSDCTAVISLDKEGSKPIIYFGKINQLYEMEMIRKKLSDEDRINEKLMERESIRQVLSSDDGTTEMMREKLMKKPSRLPPLYAAIVKVDQLMAYKAQGTYKPLPVYPAISRDLAFVANDMCRHQDIINVIQSIQETHLEQVELFDVYQSEAIGTGKKSMAYSLRFRSSERTLTDEEVNKTHEAIKQALKNKLVDIQFREGLNDLMQK